MFSLKLILKKEVIVVNLPADIVHTVIKKILNMKNLITLLFALSLLSCGQSGNNLASQKVPNATSQTDIDKNLIIDYAIANNLDLKSTPSGIYYVMTQEGDGGEHPTASSQIEAHYHGTLLDGTVFDSSVKRGKPLNFKLNGVIKGWQEAIPMLTKGGKGKFFLPSHLAYGARGSGSKIGPNSVLIFDIELVDFK